MSKRVFSLLPRLVHCTALITPPAMSPTIATTLHTIYVHQHLKLGPLGVSWHRWNGHLSSTFHLATAQYMLDFPCISHSYQQVQQDRACFKPSRAGITHYPLIGLWVTSDPPDFRHFLSIFYGFPSTFHQYIDFHAHMCLFGYHHPPLSIWANFFVIWPQCHRLSAICSPNNSAFSPTSSNFRVFAHACTCFGSSSTHPGLPSPSSNWPHIPPSVRPPTPPTIVHLGDFFIAWPQCQDRKSTRLNSSHTVISYAVFCLKKKK